MIKLIEELYNSNEISEEVKNRLLDKHFNRETGPCSAHARESDRMIEEEEKWSGTNNTTYTVDEEVLEERMKIIGQNGNTGEHYDDDNVREEALRKEKEYYSKLRGDSSGTID
tara:strand:- start:2136 stop:2474 length:339 start_codon:yes stop_codon:yes gene_type:complete